MGFRFRQRIKILPGIYLNIGKKGINSTSLRAGRLTTNLNGKGAKHTLGAHGTGLSYETERQPYKFSKKLLIVVVLFVIVFLVT